MVLAPHKDITPKFLIQLAPLDYWLHLLGSRAGSISSSQFQGIYDGLCRISQRMSRIDPRMKMRGLGACLDNGHWVYHLGDRLLVDNAEAQLDDIRLQYLYSEEESLPLASAAADDLLLRFRKAVMGYKWKEHIHGRKFIGWLLASLVGGALEWRPYLWLLAPPRSGKSWLADNVISPFFGEYGQLLAKSTTAGIMRLIGNDALPIIVDEAEPEKDGAIRQMLAALRSSSSGTGLHMKSAQDERGVVAMKPRASLLFSSTQLPRMDAATRSRFEMIRLTRPDMDDARFRQVAAPIQALKGEDYAHIRAWTILNMQSICARIDRFITAVSSMGLDNRESKNVGACLGAYASIDGRDPDDCSWLEEELTGRANPQDEAERVLEEILALRLRTTEGEDISIATAVQSPAQDDIARSYGVVLEGGYLHIAPDHQGLVAKLKGSSIAAMDIGEALLQLPGAERGRQKRFGGIRKVPIVINVDAVKDVFDHADTGGNLDDDIPF